MTLLQVRPTIILASIAVLILAQRYGVLFLFLLAIPFLPWLLYSVYVIAMRPARRILQISKVAIWAGALATIAGVHYYRHVSTRAHADQVVQLVRQYSAKHKHCPPDLAAAGLSQAYIKDQFRHLGYFCEPGQVTLFYPSVYMPFEVESYDFKTGIWTHRYD